MRTVIKDTDLVVLVGRPFLAPGQQSMRGSPPTEAVNDRSGSPLSRNRRKGTSAWGGDGGLAESRSPVMGQLRDGLPSLPENASSRRFSWRQYLSAWAADRSAILRHRRMTHSVYKGYCRSSGQGFRAGFERACGVSCARGARHSVQRWLAGFRGRGCKGEGVL